MKIGIYYFSGTGNTKFIGEQIKEKFESKKNGDNYLNEVAMKDISGDANFSTEEDLIIIGGPIYAGNMPEKLIRWVLRNVPETDKKTKVVIYSTSAGLLNANGVDSIASKLSKKGYEVLMKECFVMPRNFYFGSYEPNTPDEIERMIAAAELRVGVLTNELNKTLEGLHNGKACEVLEISHKGVLGKDMFAELFSVMAKFMGRSFKSDDKCIRCGKCASGCPQKNIQLKGKGIQHSNKCMMCTKCLHVCPVNSINYNGKKYDQYNRFL